MAAVQPLAPEAAAAVLPEGRRVAAVVAARLVPEAAPAQAAAVWVPVVAQVRAGERVAEEPAAVEVAAAANQT